MSIAHRIFLVFLIPVFAFLGSAALIVEARISVSAKLDQSTAAAAIIQSLDDLIDAVQMERGRSSEFLGSKGVQGASDLSARRQISNQRGRAFESAVDPRALALFNGDMNTAAGAAIASLRHLPELRGAVTALEIGEDEATRQYSEIVDNLLAASLAVGRDTDQPGLENNALALEFVQAAKERAGLIRSTGAAGLADGAMSAAQLYRLAALGTEEAEHIRLFEIYGPASVRDDYATKSASDEAKEAVRLRRLVLETPAGQKIADLDADRWFKAATARVDLLGHVQNQILAAVLAQVTEARSAAIASLVITTSLIVAVLAGVTALGFFVMRSISRPIVDVARSMAALASVSLRREVETKAQMGLDANLTALREMLNAHGKPRREGDKLYFGDYLVGATNEVVDQVQSRFGGTATIFLGDVRVATNVLKPDGSRALGTKLARGPAYDAVFTHAKMFKGEAQVFDKTYVALYEPILDGKEVLGVLYVGVLKQAMAKEGELTPRGRDEVREMQATLAILEQATKAKEQIERDALEQRYQATDRAREATARSQSLAAEQKMVVAALSAALESLANTDLTYAIEAQFPAEFQNLKTNFAAAAQILGATMSTISAQASAISEVTAGISQANDDLSKRTEQQAASLEQTAAALNQITANVKQTADGASHASEVVTTTKDDAERSGDVVRRAVSAMGGIQQSSQKIGQIIGVIDEIAFQTNLLALNAGVEAARAGEAGRGFAVVAAEVRALALRSAEAAKEIKTLISASSRQVDDGVKLVDETGSALERILEQVAEINGIISNIAAATKEQATGLAEVNTAIDQMDHFTQQNAAMVEQSAAAGHTLQQQTAELTRLIGRFRIDRQPLAGSTKERLARKSGTAASRNGSREPRQAQQHRRRSA